MSGIITRLALDTFTPDELEAFRMAARSLGPGDQGLVILPGKPELYKISRARDGVTLDLATDEEAARMIAGAPR